MKEWWNRLPQWERVALVAVGIGLVGMATALAFQVGISGQEALSLWGGEVVVAHAEGLEVFAPALTGHLHHFQVFHTKVAVETAGEVWKLWDGFQWMKVSETAKCAINVGGKLVMNDCSRTIGVVVKDGNIWVGGAAANFWAWLEQLLSGAELVGA